MNRRFPKYPKEEFLRRGKQLFEESIKAQVSDQNPQHIVAIDIDSGDFEVDADSLTATDRLFSRRPDAQILMIRVDGTAVLRIRPRLVVGEPIPPSDKPRWRKLS